MKKRDAKAMSDDSIRREKTLIAIRKAETSLRRIATTVERGETGCFPVIQQTLSVIGLLKSANLLMLEGHMEREMDGIGSGDLSSLRMEILKIIKASQNK
jgi:DNA-binding FrmR family transcriptional regulator